MFKLLSSTALIMLLTGCAAKPLNYNLTNTVTDSPITVSKNLPNIRVTNFVYEPHRNISQYETSIIGCPFCDPNGGREHLVFQQPLNQIIQTEVEKALNEVMLKNSESVCSISAQIQFVGIEQTFSSMIHRVDATYTLSKGDATYFVKRVVGNFTPGVFELDRGVSMWARPVRDSIRQLVADKSFQDTVDQRCR